LAAELPFVADACGPNVESEAMPEAAAPVVSKSGLGVLASEALKPFKGCSLAACDSLSGPRPVVTGAGVPKENPPAAAAGAAAAAVVPAPDAPKSNPPVAAGAGAAAVLGAGVPKPNAGAAAGAGAAVVPAPDTPKSKSSVDCSLAACDSLSGARPVVTGAGVPKANPPAAAAGAAAAAVVPPPDAPKSNPPVAAGAGAAAVLGAGVPKPNADAVADADAAAPGVGVTMAVTPGAAALPMRHPSCSGSGLSGASWRALQPSNAEGSTVVCGPGLQSRCQTYDTMRRWWS